MFQHLNIIHFIKLRIQYCSITKRLRYFFHEFEHMYSLLNLHISLSVSYAKQRFITRDDIIRLCIVLRNFKSYFKFISLKI